MKYTRMIRKVLKSSAKDRDSLNTFRRSCQSIIIFLDIVGMQNCILIQFIFDI